MSGQQVWIRAGDICPRLDNASAPCAADEAGQLAEGQVRLTITTSGTEVKWSVDTPCVASRFRAMYCLDASCGPFVLRFHALGWFEEIFETVADTVARMEAILARGDRYFASRAFVKESEFSDSHMPQVLRESLERQNPPDDYCVDCAFDEVSSNYIVDRIGSKSAIGRVWGTFTSSFPCQAKSRYGDAVSAAYKKVLDDGQPRYDQVLAAMRLPDNQVHWVPYHRVIFPSLRRQGLPAVTIVSEIAKVEISVI